MSGRKIGTLPIKYRNGVKNPENYNWEIPHQAHHPLRPPQPVFMNAIDGTPFVPIRSRQQKLAEHSRLPPPYEEEKVTNMNTTGTVSIENMKVNGLRTM